MSADRERAARAIADFLDALGFPPTSDPELTGTPERVASAFIDELLEGYAVDVPALLRAESSMSTAPSTGFVTVRDIAITTVCPHHLLPARGVAAVVYEPGERIAGIGTIARVVLAFARRLTLQEAIGNDVVDALVTELGAKGAACQLTLVHECLASRGERQSGATIETLAFAGAFDASDGARELAALALRKGGS